MLSCLRERSQFPAQVLQISQLVLCFSFNELIFSSAGEFQTCYVQSYCVAACYVVLGGNLSQVSPCKIHPEHLMAVFFFIFRTANEAKERL